MTVSSKIIAQSTYNLIKENYQVGTAQGVGGLKTIDKAPSLSSDALKKLDMFLEKYNMQMIAGSVYRHIQKLLSMDVAKGDIILEVASNISSETEKRIHDLVSTDHGRFTGKSSDISASGSTVLGNKVHRVINKELAVGFRVHHDYKLYEMSAESILEKAFNKK